MKLDAEEQPVEAMQESKHLAKQNSSDTNATMTQRVKNHSDLPPSILVWTFRAPIPRPGSVGDRTRGWGARREVPGGAYR